MMQHAPRTILMTADAVGGVFPYALELIRALQPSGTRVVLATMGRPPDTAQRGEIAALGNVELVESHYRLEWMPDAWDDVDRAGNWLLDLEVRFRPDLIHLNGYVHGALPWNAPVLVVGHSCVLSWWRAVMHEPAPGAWNRYRDRVKAGLAASDLVVAPSAAMLIELERLYGPLRGARVIPNGRSPKLFRPAPKRPIILTAGRLWDQAKNVALLEGIASRLKWPVYAAGEGADSESPNFYPLGRLPHATLADWFSQASIYALPARYEPFGLSVLEAALSGCALVLGDIPSLRENWDGAARFISPDDPEAAVRAMNSLIDDRPARLALKAAARERALRFTPEKMARAYLAAYEALLARRFACAS